MKLVMMTLVAAGNSWLRSKRFVSKCDFIAENV